MYRLEVLPEIEEQMAALPVDALVSLAEVRVMLELTPWSGDPLNREHPERNMRSVLFGPNGEGLLVYLILEDQRRVIPLQMTWLG
ncbi:hypothetical protein [Kineosporia sp. NBRC 101731]|uniref:hypothetical protein n=1 Tax=Kineosporia sp. NBRC 101731 TaxID=3032199 RepID=UPI0024A42052|nr:hypothetical protein [Kineosporia sp. NBRC 101731]GLY27418.1 hypothetical protein Kisp02_07830 [Kineosporia sp. NBRC 101731]